MTREQVSMKDKIPAGGDIKDTAVVKACELDLHSSHVRHNTPARHTGQRFLNRQTDT